MRGAKARMSGRGKVKLDLALQAECVVVTKHTQKANVKPFDSSWVRDSKEEVAYIKAHRHISFTPSNVLAESPLYAVWRCTRMNGTRACGNTWTATCFRRSNTAVGKLEGHHCNACSPRPSSA